MYGEAGSMLGAQMEIRFHLSCFKEIFFFFLFFKLRIILYLSLLIFASVYFKTFGKKEAAWNTRKALEHDQSLNPVCVTDWHCDLQQFILPF